MIGKVLMFAGFGMLGSVSAMAGPPNQWTESSRTMSQYLAEGYQVVGFDVAPQPNRFMDVTAMRYVLQKGARLVLCSEKLSTTTGEAVVTGCHELTPSPEPTPASP